MGALETTVGATGERHAVAEDRVSASITWLATAAVVAATASLVQIGADARWLAALGARIASARSIPDGVPYAADPSAGWHNAPVVGELVFHGLYAALADHGLILAQVAAVMVALLLLARDMRAADATDTAAGLMLLTAAVAAAPALLVVRAQLFSLALFPLLLLLLRSDARNPSRRVWLVVPLLALWANLHGGVLVGALIAGIYLTVHRLRRDWTAACVVAASAAALLATPALFGTVDYYRRVLGGELAARASQLWAPLSLHAPFDVVFLVLAIPLCLLTLQRRLPTWELVALVALGAMAVHANRNTVWFALFVAVPAARNWGVTFGSGRVFALPNFALTCVLAVAAAVSLTRPPVQTAAGAELLRDTEAAAQGEPVLADPLNGEQLALAGQTIWLGNPLEAFGRRQQRLYLDWLDGLTTGDGQLTAKTCAVLVTIDSKPQRRLARNPAYRELQRDDVAALYRRTSCAR
jgi:hypothetical protein